MDQKQSNSKEFLERLSFVLIIGGLFALIMQGFAYLLILAKDLLESVGDVLISAFGGLPPLIIIAIILFIAAGIIKIGTFLKEENPMLYVELTFSVWLANIIILFILSIDYMFNKIPASLLVGIGFILFISPPFIFMALKGITKLINTIKKNEWRTNN